MSPVVRQRCVVIAAHDDWRRAASPDLLRSPMRPWGRGCVGPPMRDGADGGIILQLKQLRGLVRIGRRKAGADWLSVVAERVIGDIWDDAVERGAAPPGLPKTIADLALAGEAPYGAVAAALLRAARRLLNEEAFTVMSRMHSAWEKTVRLDERDGRACCCTDDARGGPCRGEAVALAGVSVIRQNRVPLAAVVEALGLVVSALDRRERERGDVEERAVRALREGGGPPRL